MPRPRSSESGFSLVLLVGGIAVMMILMTAAAPTWRYLMQDDREQELFFRGDQIARAIEEFQRKNGGAFPPSLDVLVQGKYLRKKYKEPMAKDGQWRLIRPGEAVAAGGGLPGSSPRPGRAPSFGQSPTPAASATPPPSVFGAGSGTPVGAVAGVASRSTDTSLRVFNGRTRYDQWVFLAGQPRRLGRDVGPLRPGGAPGGLGGLSGGGLGGSPRPSAAPLR